MHDWATEQRSTSSQLIYMRAESHSDGQVQALRYKARFAINLATSINMILTLRVVNESPDEGMATKRFMLTCE